MNKLHPSEENPLDLLVYRLTEALLPFMYRTGHTPNVITTYSFVCGLAAVAAVWYDRLAAFVVCFAASYVFDCMDGQLARQYGMTSAFGDLYDHVTDVVVYVLLLVVVLRRRRRPVPAWAFVLLAAGLAMLTVNLGCQQRRRAPEAPEETLDALTVACPYPDEWIAVTRFFSAATLNLGTVLLVLYLCYPTTNTKAKAP